MSHKIDIVLARLDGMFKKRKLKKEDMEKIFEGIVGNSEGMRITPLEYYVSITSSKSLKYFFQLMILQKENKWRNWSRHGTNPNNQHYNFMYYIKTTFSSKIGIG